MLTSLIARRGCCTSGYRQCQSAAIGLRRVFRAAVDAQRQRTEADVERPQRRLSEEDKQ